MAVYDVNGNIISLDNAVLDGMMTSVKTSETYNAGRIERLEKLHSEDFSVPVLRLYGDISSMTKDTAVNLKAVYSDGVRDFECIAKTKWQGEGSLSYEKKNYNVSFVDGKKNKVLLAFKDWFPTSKFHLKANASEPSLVRNSVGSQLGRKAYPFLYPNNAKGVIDSFPFVIYINDTFQGCYTWNTTQNDDLFAMDESNDNHMAFRLNTSAETGSWRLENFEDRLRDDSTEYSLSCLQRMVDWVANCTTAEFKANVKQYFDLDSLLYYWCTVDIECATDSMANNTTWVSWDGQHWYITWYDTDLIFGMGSRLAFSPTLDLRSATATGQFTYKHNPIWDKLFDAYYDELCAVYAELRATIFPDAETIIKYFTDYRDQWGSDYLAMEREKWPPANPNKDIALCGNDISARLSYCDGIYDYTEQ